MMQALTLRQFKVIFRSGKEIILNEGQAHAVDKAYDSFKTEGKDRMLKLPDGSKILVSRLVAIDHYVDAGLVERERARENLAHIEAIIKRIPQTSPVKELWLKRIKLNLKRREQKLPWFYDEEDFEQAGQEYSGKGIIKNTLQNVKEVFNLKGVQ